MDAAELDSLYAALGRDRPPPRPYFGKALEAAIPSWWVATAVIAASAAVGVLGRRAMRRTIMGDKVSYERYERHTPGCLEVYERFEQGTIFVQRG